MRPVTKNSHHTMVQVRHQEDILTGPQEMEGTRHGFWQLSF